MIRFGDSFKRIVKSGMQRIAPDAALVCLSIRSRRLREAQAWRLGLVDLASRLADQTASMVQSGPFAGMLLDVGTMPVHVTPKLLGTYENELTESIDDTICRAPEIVINVGCAEGYYAVGFALRLSDATIYAFDADPKARKATIRNASLNGVDARVHVSGVVHARELEGLLQRGRALVLMDCEGAEFELLHPEATPSLASADIIVELHPHRRPTVEETIIARFCSTHMIERIVQRSIDAKLARAPSLLDVAERRAAVDERRSRDICWMFLRAAS